MGGFSYRQLLLISVVSLFVEMMMIRWVSSEIRIFAYFKNFVLVACFLGFGLGCYFSRRRVQLVALITPMLLLTLILKAPISPLGRPIAALPSLPGASVEVHVWGVPTLPTSWASVVLALSFVVPLFAAIATAFIPFGQLVGWYLENASRGVAAYSINVLASLAGIAGFTLLCFVDQPPWVWFLGAGVVLLAVFWRNRRARISLAASLLVCVALLAIPRRSGRTYWSPYQKLTIKPVFVDGRVDAYSLSTNDSIYQMIVDPSPEFVQSHPAAFQQFPLPKVSVSSLLNSLKGASSRVLRRLRPDIAKKYW